MLFCLFKSCSLTTDKYFFLWMCNQTSGFLHCTCRRPLRPLRSLYSARIFIAI